MYPILDEPPPPWAPQAPKNPILDFIPPPRAQKHTPNLDFIPGEGLNCCYCPQSAIHFFLAIQICLVSFVAFNILVALKIDENVKKDTVEDISEMTDEY